MFRLNVSSRVEMSNACTRLYKGKVYTFPSTKYNESVVDALTMVQSLRKTIYLAIEKFRVCSRSDTFPCVDESRFFFFFSFFFLPAIGSQRWGSVNREAAIETSAILPFVWAKYFSQREKELKKKKNKNCSRYHYTFPTLYNNESPGLLIALVSGKKLRIYIQAKNKKKRENRERSKSDKEKRKKKKKKR